MEIKGIDYKSGVARFRGNTDRFNNVLKKFAEGQDLMEMPFEEAMEPANITETKTRIHTLKGVAGNLSIDGVFRLCAEFEKTIVDGNPDKELYDSVSKEYNDVRAEIKAKLSNATPAAASGNGSRSACLAVLAELRRNAERYDAAACEMSIRKLRGSKWIGVDSMIIDSIITFAESYNFDEAVMLIDTL